jgi:hypothetical protein
VNLVRHVGRDSPRPARREVALLIADAEGHGSAHDDAELLVRMAVLGNHAAGIELDDGEGALVAVDEPREDVLPDPDGGDVAEILECAQEANLAAR